MGAQLKSVVGRSPTIVVVMASLAQSGGLKMVLDLVAAWRRDGADARLFVVQKVVRQEAAEVDNGLRVEYGTDRPGRFRYQWPWALRRLVRETRGADLVLSGADVGNGLLLGWVAARLTRRPYVVFVQSDLDDALRTLVSRRYAR